MHAVIVVKTARNYFSQCLNVDIDVICLTSSAKIIPQFIAPIPNSFFFEFQTAEILIPDLTTFM